MLEYFATIIALAGFGASLYFNNKSLKNTVNTQEEKRQKDAEKRQEDLIKKAVQDAERHAEIINHLNILAKNTDENKREISTLNGEVKRLSDRQILNVNNIDSALDRIEKVETRLEKLHKEHRDNMGKCRCEE